MTTQPKTKKTLINIYQSRPDLQKEFPDLTGKGVSGNWTINDWWNRYGVKEHPDIELVQPGQVQNVSSDATGASGSNVSVNNDVGVGDTKEYSPYQQAILDAIAKQTASYDDYKDFLKNQPSASDQYKTFSEQLGISDQQSNLQGLTQQIADVETMLDKLEGDINADVQGKLVTEGQRRRILASEQKPLTEQLADLYRSQGVAQSGLEGSRQQLSDLIAMAGQDAEKAQELAKLNLDQTTANLPLLKEAYTYESPQDKLAQMIAQEQSLKEQGLGSYYQDQWSEPYMLGGDYVQKNLKTGQIRTAVNVPVSGGGTGGGTPTPIQDKTDYRDVLYSVGLPVNISTTSGEISKGSLDKLVNAGIPVTTAQGIYDTIIQGHSLEEIRQYLRDNGADPVILDIFMQTLQGNSEKDELDNLIDKYLGA